jgi:hypothetical protein
MDLPGGGVNGSCFGKKAADLENRILYCESTNADHLWPCYDFKWTAVGPTDFPILPLVSSHGPQTWCFELYNYKLTWASIDE